MNNSDVIVKILKDAGVTHGFGVPSGNVLPLIEAMRLGGLEFVLTAHEGSAGFAADVMGRMTGRPGLCIATLGPGATNLATGVGSAWLDRSPMIAITCTLNTPQLNRRIQMWIDHHALFAPITKASLAATRDTAGEVMRRAVELALTEPMGPVHVDLPEDVSLAPAPEGSGKPWTASVRPVAAAPDAEIDSAAELIAGARRPLAIVGSSAMRMRDPGWLRRFIEHHGIPFGSSTMAKGLIDEDHPLSFGCIERGCRQVQRRFIRSADLVIGLGFDTVEVEYEAWVGDVPVLSIDIEEPDIDDSVRLAATVTGRSGLVPGAAARARAPAANAWAAQEVAAHRTAFQAALRPESPGFAAHEAIDVVREVLPDNGIISYDVGAHTHQIASQWTAHHPRTCHVTNGWSSMGIGLPGAIAAKIARPDLPVVCVIGDGCFQMTAGEVATARRLELPLPVVVLNDRWLSLIQIKQVRRQYATWGSQVEMGAYGEPPAHYFGVPAVGVRDGGGLKTALSQALAASGPTIIEAIVDADHFMETVFD